MGDTQPVDVLLPERFDRSGRTRYPVLYLLHGAGGSYTSWISDQHMRALISRLPMIVVMPNGSQNGQDGGYSDWFGLPPGASGAVPAWESFHVRELIPFVDAHFPTLRTPAGRAVAGISMGGGGAAKYAAEYPGTFGYAGSLSGETNPELPVAEAFQPKSCKWGDPTAEEVVWRDNDSTNLASNFHGVRLFIRSGDGTPGRYDTPTPPTDPIQAAIRAVQLVVEYGAHLESEAFVSALHAADVGSVDAHFHPGSHSEPYWIDDMRAFVAWLGTQLRHPPRTRRAFSVASAHTSFTAWGWTFQLRRQVREFVYVTVTRDQLRATGSGGLDATTPGRYRPGTTYLVRFERSIESILADKRGRLHLRLDLGPSHTHRQTTFDSTATRGWRAMLVKLPGRGAS